MATTIAGECSSFKSMVNFRVAYLKALALSWSDPDIEEDFTNGKNILEKPMFTKLLTEPIHWTAVVTVTKNKKDAHLDTQWLPGATASWFGLNDKFVINLPAAPENPSDYAIALASYNQIFPTLMGIKPGSDEGMEGVSEDFISFSNALLQAIALCWATKNKEKPEESKILNCASDNLNSYNFAYLLEQYGLEALTSFIGFRNPWDFNFAFKEAPTAKWDNANQQWINLYNEVHLNYAIPPANNELYGLESGAIKAIALAQYNASSEGYPFSCA